ncbi:uncharacterized protein LOC143422373 [Xylocopa sonorina]|uniref:uncharacterized protein LOC143422373 n=1 Tax=Xylocopa sonorina TaxID=1818115 RepID=UPI00403A8B8C
MGLELCPQKMEIFRFRLPWRGAPAPYLVRIRSSDVQVAKDIKYLSVYLDSSWSFVLYFARLAVRLSKLTTHPSRIMPNLGGPSERVPRLYCGVIKRVALYGAPVWADALITSRKSITLLRRLPPIELLALEDDYVYWRLCLGRISIPSGEMTIRDEFRLQARRSTMSRWRDELSRCSEHWTSGLILPILDR